MSFKLEFGELAIADLREIDRYVLAAADADTADRYLARIAAATAALTEFPHRGTPRDDLLAGIRSITFERRIVIFYRVEAETVIVMRLVSGTRRTEGLSLDD